LREELRSFVKYERGEFLREKIHQKALKKYKQRYSDREQLDFLERHQISIRINHPQSENHPYYYTMFSIITQHIMGDTVAELLDKALDIEKDEVVN